MSSITNRNMSGKALGLVLSIAMSMVLLSTLLLAGDAGRVQAQATSDCSNGVAVPDPDDNPGLVADCEALLAARDTLAGTASLNWSPNLLINAWDGVAPAGSPSRVYVLHLTANVDTKGKALTGQIPSELGRLTGLRRMFLGNPTRVCSESGCRDIEDSEHNRLTGPIPPELGNLTNLEKLYLFGNQLSGEIPSQIGNLTNLSDLQLQDNQLSGAIPAGVENLSNLTKLFLSDNQLSGAIPPALGNLSNLTSLLLSGNQLSGCVPGGLRDVEYNDFDDLGLPFCDSSTTPTPTPEPSPTATPIPTSTPTPTPVPTLEPSPTPTPEPSDSCVMSLSGDGAITGTWSDDCALEGRSGSYAGYYTFTLVNSSDVTITAESSVDTYLLLREGSGRDGAELCSNDDYDSDVSGDECQSIESTLGGEFDSGLVASLGAGSYTIEVTTYTAGETGTFTLTVSGLSADVAPTPTPEPTTTPTPEPTPTPTPEPADECVSVVSDNGAISGRWNSDCDSEGRSGSYASYYTFTLTESADVTITAESDVDTWLFLREGTSRDGTDVAENDDHADESNCTTELERTTDSCIVESLDSGTYTIEVTTYTAGETGEFTLTVSGLPAAVTPTLTPTPSPTPEPTTTITFGDLNWSSVMLQNRIAQYIAEKGYGYSTGVEFGATRPLFQALRAGNIDVIMEVWLPNAEEVWEEALREGAVSSPGRSLGTDWQSAFVIPKYLQEQYPDLDSVEDLKEEQYRSLFATDETDGKARLVSCVVGWQCEEVNAKQVEGYGLSDHVHIVNPASAEALDADLTEAYENEKPWLGFQWGTNEPALLFDLVRLEEPAYSDECWSTTMACAYEDATILIAVNAGLSESADDFVDVLTEWDFNVDGNYKPVVRWQSANPDANLEDAALWWLRENGDVWSEWVTTDASVAIQNALDSGELPEGWPQSPNITPVTTPTPEPTPTPTPEPPADECVSVVSGNGAITGNWSSDCASEGRSGSYASYYTFTLTESADVTITAESSVDTYLFLREGDGQDGTDVADNDDHADESDCTAELERTTDSCIVESLEAGTYTIEVTTYTAGETGEFTLTIGGLPAVATPTPEPTPTPTPAPSADECVSVVSDNGAITGNWSSDCASEGRSGSYANYYTFTLTDSADVTITAESDVDTWLFLREDAGRDGTEVANNDDHADESDCTADLERTTDSCIVESLDSGTYTIEVTTYTAGDTGEFTLTIDGLPTAVVSGPSTDRAALAALYNATNGANWTDKDKWLSDEPLSEWHGVTTDDDGRVTQIDLWGNNLVGSIPVELGNLSDLERLFVYSNQLSGEIPDELGNLSNLVGLYLTRNQLSGEIPDELGRMTSLEELALGGNQLIGEIPSELGNLANLTGLHLWKNLLTGEIPAELGNLSNLTILELNDNDLSGEIPSELLGISGLMFMALYGNQLTDGVPEHADERAILTTLYNSTGGADWGENENWGSSEPVLAWDRVVINTSGNVTALWLNMNELSGELPSELGSLTSLARLYLNGNQLSGEIPSELGDLEDLEELFLAGNQLSGCIPTGLQDVPRHDFYDLGLEFCSDEN